VLIKRGVVLCSANEWHRMDSGDEIDVFCFLAQQQERRHVLPTHAVQTLLRGVKFASTSDQDEDEVEIGRGISRDGENSTYGRSGCTGYYALVRNHHAPSFSDRHVHFCRTDFDQFSFTGAVRNKQTAQPALRAQPRGNDTLSRRPKLLTAEEILFLASPYPRGFERRRTICTLYRYIVWNQSGYCIKLLLSCLIRCKVCTKRSGTRSRQLALKLGTPWHAWTGAGLSELRRIR